MVLFLFRKQTALLSGVCVRRRYIFAITNAKVIEPGEEVLMSVSELET